MFILAIDFCAKTANVWSVLGFVLLVFKIVIPLLIIIFGMIDLGKAVVSSADDEVKKAIKSLAFRIIAGVIIFFIPTLVSVVFNLIAGFNKEASDDYEVCSICISNPNGNCACFADNVWNGTNNNCSVK